MQVCRNGLEIGFYQLSHKSISGIQEEEDLRGSGKTHWKGEGHKDTDATLPHSDPVAQRHPTVEVQPLERRLAPVLTKPRRGRAQRCCITQLQHLQLQRSSLVSVPLPRQCSLAASGLLHMEHLWPLLNYEGLSILSRQPIFLILHGLVWVSPRPPPHLIPTLDGSSGTLSLPYPILSPDFSRLDSSPSWSPLWLLLHVPQSSASHLASAVNMPSKGIPPAVYPSQH